MAMTIAEKILARASGRESVRVGDVVEPRVDLAMSHENAALVDFDFDILQDEIYEAVRDLLGDQGPTLDVFALQDADPAALRYG